VPDHEFVIRDRFHEARRRFADQRDPASAKAALSAYREFLRTMPELDELRRADLCTEFGGMLQHHISRRAAA
jgi:hypothetical protein